MSQLAIHLIQAHPTATIRLNEQSSDSEVSLLDAEPPTSQASTVADQGLQNLLQAQTSGIPPNTPPTDAAI
jgi:hypothetical protein